MLPKTSQLLTRVLAREHDGRYDSSGSSSSEEDYGLQHMAANASAGLRMEMEMARESRARDAKEGVDRNACIVDRQQFFNTQIGVGYQHKTVVRQRTAEPESIGQRIIDMSVERQRSGGKRLRREEGRERNGVEESVYSDGRGGGDRKNKSRKLAKSKKSKSKEKKRDRERSSSKKGKKSKNERRRASSRRGESRKSSRRDRVSRAVESGSDTDSNTEERNGNPSSSSRLHKRSGKRSNGRRSTRKQKSAGGKESEDDKRKTARKSSSSSPSSSSSDSDLDSNDDRGAPKVSESRSMPPRHAGITCEGSQAADGVVPGDTPIDRARVPLQRLRNLIEEKLRSKARESKAKLGNEEKEVVADIDSG